MEQNYSNCMSCNPPAEVLISASPFIYPKKTGFFNVVTLEELYYVLRPGQTTIIDYSILNSSPVSGGVPFFYKFEFYARVNRNSFAVFLDESPTFGVSLEKGKDTGILQYAYLVPTYPIGNRYVTISLLVAKDGSFSKLIGRYDLPAFKTEYTG